ncbi:MAG: hypothetical protein OEY64_01695 [Nitrospinota bacterium]|nr:hypothetical protein [Nitrospinota bacterium]
MDKIKTIVISVVAFAVIFFILDYALQAYQGLELFPSQEGH